MEQLEQYSGFIILIIFILGTLVEIAPVKISPLNWIGKRLNKDTNEMVQTLNTRLEAHIVESQRIEILDFCNACMNKRKHTKEQFVYIIGVCDSYEKYCKTNNIPNGVADCAISEIRRIYAKCIRENLFLFGDKEDNK